MDENVHYEQLYRELIGQMEMMHKENLHRIKIGFRSLIIVPTIFLFLLFFTKSSKTAFLVLWIMSMFIIAVYLVIIEYSDYKLQEKLNEATNNEGAQIISVMEESIESNKSAMHELLMREENKLPFKFGFMSASDEQDDGEYDTGDDKQYAESMAFARGIPNAFDDDSGEYDEELDHGGLDSDEVFTFGQNAVPNMQADESGEDIIPIFDLDDDLDDINTLLADDDSDAEDSAETSSSEDVTEEVSPVIPLPNTQPVEDRTSDDLDLDRILAEYRKDSLESDIDTNFSEYTDFEEQFIDITDADLGKKL